MSGKRRHDLSKIGESYYDQYGNHVWTEEVWDEVEIPNGYLANGEIEYITRDIFRGVELWACPKGKKAGSPMEHFPKFQMHGDNKSSVFGLFADSQMAFDQWNHEIEQGNVSQQLHGYKLTLQEYGYVDGNWQRIEPLIELQTEEGTRCETWETLFDKNNWGAFRDILPVGNGTMVEQVRKEIDSYEEEMEESYNEFYPAESAFSLQIKGE